MAMDIAELERQLDEFDGSKRRVALEQLAAIERAGGLPAAPVQPAFNLHAHTFFSYNGAGYSPSHLVWRAHRKGWWSLATVDFDVLDGVDETLGAGDLVGLRSCAGMESRVHIRELQDVEVNSPGEPGVMYLVGVGFAASATPASASPVLQDMRARAQSRNREMISRLNAYLDPVTITLESDVTPLTPAGNATERHVLVAYDTAARRCFAARSDLVAFWADRLGMPAGDVDALLGDVPYPHDAFRSRLMKRGSVGYVQPGPNTFPSLDTVVGAIATCGAIPTYPYLDGTSAAETQLGELLELLIAHGIGGITVIPDRNWNIRNADEKALKLDNLARAMALAEQLDLPVLAGTEMNKPGQRELDDFASAELLPFWPVFQRGAAWLWGHTVMARRFGCGDQSEWARGWLPARRDRNAFFVELGQALRPSDERLDSLAELLVDGPRAVRAALAH